MSVARRTVDSPGRRDRGGLLVAACLFLSLFGLLNCAGRGGGKAAAPALGAGDGTGPPDIVITGARVWTGDVDRPLAEAVAVRGERISAVGSRTEITALVGEGTLVIDAPGGLVTPGFIDSHVHFIEAGRRLSFVQLREATSEREFVRQIARFAAAEQPGNWITGGQWDQTRWGGDLPHRVWIDSVTPDNPVFIGRVDGHMGLANSRALAAAGIDESTPDVSGGEIQRDPDGRPTGILKDNAMGLVFGVLPPPTSEQDDRALEAAMEHVAAHGVTSVNHMAWSWDDLNTFKRAKAAGRLTTRVYACVPVSQWERLRDLIRQDGWGDEWLHVGCLKGFLDGSLGSRTAAFLEPYDGAVDGTGILVSRPADLWRWIEEADRAGLQVLLHAIGDRANRLALNLFEHVLRLHGDRDRRFRVEHAQHLQHSDINRFSELGVIPSVQPYHIIDDGRWAEDVIGETRAQTSYPLRSLLDSRARLAFGSDWFVAPPSPLLGIYASATRRTLDGRHPSGWIPEQRITVDEALAAYTRDAAFASFEEDLKGFIGAGRLADMVLIDRDILAIPPSQIAGARILMTMVGGRIVWSDK